MRNDVQRHEQIMHALQRIEENDDAYFSYLPIIWDALTEGQREQLNQLLHQGPIFDGNVISKSCRDDLLRYDLAVRCCYLGEDGYTAASYLGGSVFRNSKAKPFACKVPSRG